MHTFSWKGHKLESSPKQSESMELKIKQINSAIENIRSK